MNAKVSIKTKTMTVQNLFRYISFKTTRTLVLISSLSIRHGSSLLKTIDYLVWLVASFETINLLSDDDAKNRIQIAYYY